MNIEFVCSLFSFTPVIFRYCRRSFTFIEFIIVRGGVCKVNAIRNEKVFTTNLKEAYEFAHYLFLTKGVGNIEIEQIEEDCYVRFTMEYRHELGKQIWNIVEQFNLESLVFYGVFWDVLRGYITE